MKTLRFIVIGALFLFLISFIQAVSFNSTIIDSGQVYSNPATSINSKGVKYITYINDNGIILINSLDNYESKVILDAGKPQYNNPAMAIDSNDVVHIVFATGCGGPTYYVNSKDLENIMQLDMNSCDSELDIAIDSKNKLYIAGQKEFSSDSDIIIATSSDFDLFNYQRIEKSNTQINPHISIDSNDIVGLVYYDWFDGVSGDVSLYRTRFRSSEDGFTVEETVSWANQVNGANIAVDKDNNFWVSFRESNYTEDPGVYKTDVYIADRNSNWNKTKITSSPVSVEQYWFTDIGVSSDGIKHVVWSYIDFDIEEVYIMYAVMNSPIKVTLQDIGYDSKLGQVSINTFENKPYIVANIHSLADYNIIEDSADLLLELQNKINNLTLEIDNLKIRVSSLENKVSFIERVINALFTWSSDFKNYFDSPDKCLNNQIRCGGEGTQKCLNYRWVNSTVCADGCTNGICNKQNCQNIPANYSCQSSNRISKISNYKCMYGQGTSIGCNPGKCQLNVYYRYCYNGCDSSTGRCKI